MPLQISPHPTDHLGTALSPTAPSLAGPPQPQEPLSATCKCSARRRSQPCTPRAAEEEPHRMSPCHRTAPATDPPGPLLAMVERTGREPQRPTLQLRDSASASEAAKAGGSRGAPTASSPRRAGHNPRSPTWQRRPLHPTASYGPPLQALELCVAERDDANMPTSSCGTQNACSG